MARQVVPAVFLAGGGGALLASMHATPSIASGGEDVAGAASTPSRPPTISLAPAATGATGGTPATVGETPATPAPQASDTPTTPASAATAPHVPAPQPQNTPQTTAPPAPTPVAASAAGASECMADPVAGPTIQTRWGPVQVVATVSKDGTKLCAVDASITPSDHRKSIRINQAAVPLLDDAAMRAQGTAFNAVSGATITSRGYKASLQAILDGLTG